MASTSIGAQMYTLREHLKTPADIARTCKRVKDMGYDAIQVSAFGKIEPAELGKILKDTGLECAATHVSLDMIKDVSACVDYHRTLGCTLPAIGGYRPETNTEQAFIDFAKQYSEIGAALKEHGLSVGYHNHSRELAWVDDARRRQLDILIEESDDNVWFEVDTYWIAHGGGDPAAWLKKCAGRCPAIHVKDMNITPTQEQKMCEVGAGNLNWPAILASAKDAGTRWYLVERDSGELDPFDSLKISLDNLKAMGLR